MKRLVLAILASLLTASCSSNNSPTTPRDASPSDAQTSYTMPEVPPGCPPAAGNEIGIGAPCTRTGNECTGGFNCSCQNWFTYPMPESMPCFCTEVAFGGACNSPCGSNATCCTYTISTITVSACFPAVCAPDGQCPSITQ